jgi:hypothetical protein
MNPNTLYLFTLFAFALLGTAFGYYFDDSDDDDDGFRIRLSNEDNETDNEMMEFNKRLDNAVDVINKEFNEKILPQIPVFRKAIKDAKKPEKISDQKWEEIKEKKLAKLRERLYNKLSAAHFRNYGNFITKAGNEDNDSMTQYGGKDIFEIPDEWYESKKATPTPTVEDLKKDILDDLVEEASVSKA